MVNCKLGDLTMDRAIGDNMSFIVPPLPPLLLSLSLVVGERKSRGREQEFIRGLIGSASRDFAR